MRLNNCTSSSSSLGQPYGGICDKASVTAASVMPEYGLNCPIALSTDRKGGRTVIAGSGSYKIVIVHTLALAECDGEMREG